jgi:hypothetical protein
LIKKTDEIDLSNSVLLGDPLPRPYIPRRLVVANLEPSSVTPNVSSPITENALERYIELTDPEMLERVKGFMVEAKRRGGDFDENKLAMLCLRMYYAGKL